MNVSEEQRSGIDRRCGKDRGKAHDVDYFLNGGVERRSWKERRAPGERREGWVRVSEWSSMFVGSPRSNTKELPAERRKYKRFHVQNGAHAVLGTHYAELLGQIIDISRGGVSFRYVAGEKPSSGSFELDISLANFYLRKVPFKNISDFQIANEFFLGSIPIRRRGVQFGELTPNRISQLEYFIQRHTTREA